MSEGFRLRQPPSVVFGRGAAERAGEIVAELAVSRPLVVTDPGVEATGLPARVRRSLEAAGLDAGLWAGLEPDPGEEVVDACRDRLLAGGHDGVVAVGGGSAIDAAKVAAVLVTNGGATADYFGFDRVRRPGIPVVAVPTTAGAGSEVSSHSVVVRREPRRKEVVGGIHLLARVALVDPAATLTLPRAATGASALDGLVHALEAFVARRATPPTDAFVRGAVPRIAAALPRVLADGADLDGREELALGCLFASLAMANANAGVIHALGYPLSLDYGVPHGLANGLMAAAALERTWPARPDRCRELAALLPGGGEPTAAELPARLARFLGGIGLAGTLQGWRVEEADLPRLARQATQFRPILDNTPVALGEEDLLGIYRAAWEAGAKAPPAGAVAPPRPAAG